MRVHPIVLCSTAREGRLIALGMIHFFVGCGSASGWRGRGALVMPCHGGTRGGVGIKGCAEPWHKFPRV